MRRDSRRVSEIALQRIASPISTGTIWLCDGITGRPAAALSRKRGSRGSARGIDCRHGSDQLSCRRHRFPHTVIQHAIWLYLRFTLSYRDVEDLLVERGPEVSYETVRRWVLKFGP